MAKVQILGYGPRLRPALDLLYGLRVVQIIDVREEPGLSLKPVPADESEERRLEELRHLRTRLDALIRLIPTTSGPVTPPVTSAVEIPALREELDELEPRVRDLVTRLDDLRAEEAALPRHIESLRKLLPLLPEIVELESYETVGLLLDRRYADLLDLLREELDELVGPRYELTSTPIDADRVGAVVIFPRSESSRVMAWLSREQVSQVRLPSGFTGLPLPRALAAMEERLRSIPGQIALVESDLGELMEGRLDRWRAARRALDDLLVQHETVAQIGSTGHAFVIEGWVPRRRLPELERSLTERVGDDVMMVEVSVPPEERERVPLLLKNPAPARPFELLIRLLGLPRYGTTDPTLLTALFLPLFFGLMVGDIGYGLILIGVAVLMGRLGRRSPTWHDLGRILLIGSIWAVLWGVVFGEVFGDLGRRLGLRPIWFDRERAIESFLLFAVAMGVFHVLLGMLLGLWVAWKERHRGTLIERGGMLVALIGLFLLAGVASGRLPAAMSAAGIAALVVGLVLLIYVEGALGFVTAPLEVMGTVTNILSYLRLAALGLASVYLARVANELAGSTGPLWLGILVAVLLHALNVVLGAFSPTIQAIRLHYVEFFGKFYEVGGSAFRPLGADGEEPPVPSTDHGR
jgi:V/A-type H+-transporting ATPase subunit I